MRVVALAIWVGAGCYGELDLDTQPFVCSVDADCAAGRRCDTERGICVAQHAGPDTVADAASEVVDGTPVVVPPSVVDGSADAPSALAWTDADGGVIAGTMTAGSESWGMVARLNADLELLWRRDFQYPAHLVHAVAGVHLTSGGEVVFVGTTETPDGDPQGWFGRVDSEGGLVVNEALGGSGADAFVQVVPAAGGVAAIGTSRVTLGATARQWRVLIDGDGALVGQTLFPNTKATEASAAVRAHTGAPIVIGGRTGQPPGWAAMLLVAEDGSEQGAASLLDAPARAVIALRASSAEQLFILATGDPAGACSLLQSINGSVSSLGAYGDAADTECHDVVRLADGSFAIVGSKNGSGWLARVSSLGVVVDESAPTAGPIVAARAELNGLVLLSTWDDQAVVTRQR